MAPGDEHAPVGKQGVAGMVKGLSTILDAWEDWRPEGEEYRELDNERILVLTHRVARGKTSRLQVHSKGANLFHLRVSSPFGGEWAA